MPFSHITTSLSLMSCLPLGQKFPLSYSDPRDTLLVKSLTSLRSFLAESSHVHICPWLYCPLGKAEKTLQILIGLTHVTSRRYLAVEDRGKPGLPRSSETGALHSHLHCATHSILCQVNAQGYTGTWQWCLKERKRPIWRHLIYP